MAKWIVLVGFLCLTACSTGLVVPDGTSFEDRYDTLARLDRALIAVDVSERSRQLASEYRHLFGRSRDIQARVPELTSQDLGWLLEAAYLVGMTTHHPEYWRIQEVAFLTLQERGTERPHHVADMFQALILRRQFGQAQRLAARYPDLHLDQVPRVHRIAGHRRGLTVYRVADDGALTEDRIPRPQGRHLVAVVHPLCAFSDRAMRYLAEHPSLLQHVPVTWITPVSGHLGMAAIGDWNRTHPHLQIVIPHAASDWPFVTGWHTPAFYLLDGQRLLGSVSGWPPEGNRKALAALLAGNGAEDAADAAQEPQIAGDPR